jgi:cell division protein FtsW
LGLFLALFVRLKNIMERAPNNYTRFIVAGVLAWLASQTLINVGAMIGLLPLKGITLPLISYGGSSLVFVLIALGLVFNISHYTTARITIEEENLRGSDNEDSTGRRRDRRTYYAHLGNRP